MKLFNSLAFIFFCSSMPLMCMEKQAAEKEPVCFTLQEACDEMAPIFDRFSGGNVLQAAALKRSFALKVARMGLLNDSQAAMFDQNSKMSEEQFKEAVAATVSNFLRSSKPNGAPAASPTACAEQKSFHEKSFSEKLTIEKQMAHDLLFRISKLNAKNEADKPIIDSFAHKFQIFEKLAQFFAKIHRKTISKKNAETAAYRKADELQKSIIELCPILIKLIERSQDHVLLKIINLELKKLLNASVAMKVADKKTASESQTKLAAENKKNDSNAVSTILTKRREKVLKAITEKLEWGLSLQANDPTRAELLESFAHRHKPKNFSSLAIKLEMNYCSLPSYTEGNFKNVFNVDYLKTHIMNDRNLVNEIIEICTFIGNVVRDNEAKKLGDIQHLEGILLSIQKILSLE